MGHVGEVSFYRRNDVATIFHIYLDIYIDIEYIWFKDKTFLSVMKLPETSSVVSNTPCGS